MNVKIILLILFTSIPASAASLKLCQESVAEDPFLREFTIHGEAYFGQHAAIVAHALQQMGIKFSLSRLPWKRCVSGVTTGVYDGVVGIGWSQERGHKLIFPMAENAVNESSRLYFVRYPIYVQSENPLVWDGSKFEHVKHGLAAPKGYLVEEKLKRLNVLQQTDAGVDVGISLLRNGRVDGVVLSEEVGDRMILEESVKDIKKLDVIFYQQPIFLAFSHSQRKLTADDIQRVWMQLPLSRAEIMGTVER